jgi:hypothetical protein
MEVLRLPYNIKLFPLTKYPDLSKYTRAGETAFFFFKNISGAKYFRLPASALSNYILLTPEIPKSTILNI